MDEDKRQQQRREEEERSTRERAAILGVEYIDTRDLEERIPLVKELLTIDQMYSGRLVPLRAIPDEASYLIGITTNTPQSLVSNVRRENEDKGTHIAIALISDTAYRVLMRRFDPPKEVHYDDVKIAKDGDSDTIEEVSRTLDSVSSDAVLTYLIEQADKLEASDIHIENGRDDIRIRMRIDGILHPVANLSKDRYRVLIGALASRANISTASTKPQSGHIGQEIGTGEDKKLLNMRVEVIPTMYGQDVVVRLFNFDESLLNLDHLGLSKADRKEIDEVVSHPRGTVLVVGPTGSGKSTTLYSMINALNTTDRKIIALEDPIEYSIPGISQVPINTNEDGTFAEGLRAVLRLDPDVVMVGEIRDVDTAKTAIQASITGHLVLSTFHATSASAAFSRMIDLIGINPIFSTAIRLVIAQRLVRRLDNATKQAYEPDEATKKWIHTVLEDLPAHVEKPNLDSITLYKPGSSPEQPFGYNGRIVVMEQLAVGERIQKYIRGDVEDVIATDIEKTAKEEGMVTLLQAGVLKALAGETTLEEINRAI